jgi:hypothetical protein
MYLILVLLCQFVNMYTSRKKIQKDKDAEPTEFEESVAQVILATVIRHSCDYCT